MAWLITMTMGLAGIAGGTVPGMSIATSSHGGPGLTLFCWLGAGKPSSASRSMALGSDVPQSMAMWAAMVLAMMLPTALPAVDHVAANSLCWRRARAMSTFVLAYVGTWLAFGLAMILALSLWSPANTGVIAALALGLAAAWQLTPQKRAALADCHRPSPLPPRGPPALIGVTRFGLRNGYACVRSCWAMMCAVVLAGPWSLLLMIAITAAAWMEKRAQRPRHTTRLVALGLTCAALMALAAGTAGL